MQDFNKDIFSEENKNNAEGNAEFDNSNNGENAYFGDGKEYSPYDPNFYVPNFTVNDFGAEPEPPKKKKGNKLAVISIIVSSVAIFMLAIALIFNNSAQSGGIFGTRVDLGGESVQIVQNAPQMNIVQNSDPNYVPQSLPEVVEKVASSVVEISTSSIQKDYFYGQYVTSGAGSGVIVTQSAKAGYLLTNYHVIYESDGSLVDNISVVLTNGEKYTASLVGSDESLDLALIRIEKKKSETFTVAAFGKSSNLKVGQSVVAIGNPLGSLGGTVTDGIISALDRRVQVGNTEMVLMQHNAAINPGNSGGGLFDMMGNLIGIVNAKTSDTGIEGLGFAIPSDIAFNFINRVMVVEPSIGIKVQYGKVNNTVGLFVVETVNNDFKKYDRITMINGQKISGIAQYYAVIDVLKSGDTVNFTVRRSGSDIKISVTLE